jgi:Cu(I)/Ag(I) efflux system periplasmic protein CusF
MVSRRSFLGYAAGVVAIVLGTTKARAAPQRYTTRGVVKSFGRARRYVNIAHEDIPGYMQAMTMSFEPSSATQLEGLVEGQRVEITFTDDGQRRILERIAKA